MTSNKFGSEATHKETSNGKNTVSSSNKDSGDEDFVWSEEGEIEKIARKWNCDGECNNTENNGEENGAEKI